MICYCDFPSIDLPATGSNIKRIAEERGISVRDIQGYFNFEYPNAVYKWYKGQSLPTVDNLLALARLLGVHMEDILVERDRDVHFLPILRKCPCRQLMSKLQTGVLILLFSVKSAQHLI